MTRQLAAIPLTIVDERTAALIDSAERLAQYDIDSEPDYLAKFIDFATIRKFIWNFCSGEAADYVTANNEHVCHTIVSACVACGGELARRKLLAAATMSLLDDRVDDDLVMAHLGVAP